MLSVVYRQEVQILAEKEKKVASITFTREVDRLIAQDKAKVRALRERKAKAEQAKANLERIARLIPRE